MEKLRTAQIGSVREIAEAMRRDHSPKLPTSTLGKTVLLIGAGCSKSAGFPLASEIAQTLVIRLAIDYGLTEASQSDFHLCIEKLIDAGKFKKEEVYTQPDITSKEIDWQNIYDILFSTHYCTPKEIRQIFSEIFDKNLHQMNWAHLCIGELVRLGYVSTVLTTNFDQLALAGITHSGRLPVVSDGIESMNRITGDSNSPQLIQIHGSRHTYYLRNSAEDVEEVSRDAGTKHAIEELLRTAKVFISIGYGGRELGIMRLLIDAAKRYPDTRIFWATYSNDANSIGPLATEFLNTSRFSKILLGQDADEFFHRLLHDLDASPPRIISDPLYIVRELTDNLVYSDSDEIRHLLDVHLNKVSDLTLANANMSALIPATDPVRETTAQTPSSTSDIHDEKLRAVSQLAGGIAHDFNNVLTAIIGFSDLLLSSHRPSDPSFQDIMNIKQNANRAASLVRQLLAFSRRQTLRPETIQLGDTLTELRMLLSRLLGENVELKVVHGRDLWPIKADQSQLEQVIVNLTVNARDAMPGGGRLTIVTRNRPAGEALPFETPGMPDVDYVQISVTDTGTGIPPEIMQKIFEPFFTTKPIGQGTGLGLSTVYGIVKQTGGFIYCVSEEGKGTSFEILLPRQIETTEKIETARPEAPAAATDLTGSATILLVEDEEAVRAFASRALQSRGYVVHEASTGTEALAVMAATQGKIDLVVSEVVLPEIDGPTLLGELRKSRPELKIIFVSDYAEDAFAKNLPEGESFHFLPKPFSLKQLATAVKQALSVLRH